MMLRANFAWILTEDKRVLEQARVGVENVLSRVVPTAPSHGKRQPPKNLRPPMARQAACCENQLWADWTLGF